MNDNQEKHTLVEEGTEFEGTMRAKCRVIVRGGFDGKLEAPSVDVAETGSVTGELKADQVRSRGILAGTIDARDVSVAGTVRSDTVIRANTLEVKLSSEEGKLEVTFGDVVVEVGEMPAHTRAGDEAPAEATEQKAEAEPAAVAASSDDAKSASRGKKGRGGKKASGDGGDDEEATEEAPAPAAEAAPAPS